MKTAMVGGETMERVMERCGFIIESEIDALVVAAPDMMMLIRYGCGRLTCRMDQVADQVVKIEKEGDYVRDVSLIADNHERILEGLPYIRAKGVTRY